jgi:hypothetical protein
LSLKWQFLSQKHRVNFGKNNFDDAITFISTSGCAFHFAVPRLFQAAQLTADVEPVEGRFDVHTFHVFAVSSKVSADFVRTFHQVSSFFNRKNKPFDFDLTRSRCRLPQDPRFPVG